MARTFRQRRQLHAVSELNITNLVDLAFVLLIIFMLATPLVNQEQQSIPLELPVESRRPQEKPDPRTVFETISIDRQGRFYVGTSSLPLTRTELSGRLQALAARPQAPVITIKADLALQWQQVVTLMDDLKKYKLTKISFDTRAGG